jgi:hypothetical protein
VVLILALLGLAGVGAFLFLHLQDLVRQQTDLYLRRLFPNLRVTLTDIRVWPGQEIELSGLALYLLGEAPGSAKGELLAKIPRIRLECEGTVWNWLRGEIQVRAVIVEGAELSVQRDSRGEWNWARIRWCRLGQAAPPQIVLEDATLQIRAAGESSQDQVFQIHRARISPEIASCPQGAGSWAQSLAPQLRWQLEAQVGKADFGEGSVKGTFWPDQGRWSLAFRLERLPLGPQLLAGLPEKLQQQLSRLRLLTGSAAVEGSIGADCLAGTNLTLQLQGRLEGVRLAVDGVATPFSDISGKFRVDSEQILVEEVQGVWGTAQIFVPRLELSRQGSTGRLAVEFAFRRLEVSAELVELHPQLRQWRQLYGPLGYLDGQGTAKFEQGQWNWQVRIFPQKMSFVYTRIPYPVREVEGWIEWTNKHLWVDLQGKAGTGAVTIQARHLWDEGAYQVLVSSRQLTIDPQMIAALGSPASQRVAELRPSGEFGFRFVATRRKKEAAPERFLEISLLGGGVQYERFPYPLRNVRGRVRMWGNAAGEHWELEETTAGTEAQPIFLRGQLDSWGGRQFLQLHFWAKDLPLSEELRQALPSPAARQLWRDLDLKGSLRELVGQVLYDSAGEGLKVRFSAEPAPGQCSIQPVWFPYRLDNVEGRLEYQDGQASVGQFRGQHGTSRVSCAVGYLQQPDGSWRLELTDLFAQQVSMDQELVQALPAGLQRVFRVISPSGTVNVRGSFLFSGDPVQPGRVRCGWSLGLDTHQARLDVGLKVVGVSGTTRLVGASDGDDFVCAAELDLTAANIWGIQLTQIRGSLWADSRRILLGRLVPSGGLVSLQNSGLIPRDFGVPLDTSVAPSTGLGPGETASPPITARMASGLLSLDGVVLLDEPPTYRLGFSLARADLTQLAQDLMGRAENLRGTLFVQGEIGGKLGVPESLTGQGRVQLRDADIYEVPLMVALLRILMIREPRRSAFSSAAMNFELEGERIIIPYVVFEGDALNFEGSGELDWGGRIHLTLRTNFGRPDGRWPIVRQWIGGASEQLVVLHVTGWLHDPLISSEPLPVVNQMLQQLQQDLNVGGQAPQSKQFPHGFLPRWVPGRR